jgi:hypothetical protein
MRYILLLLIGINQALWAQAIPVKLGDSRVIIDKQQRGEGKVFVHLHQNETTALKAARRVVSKHGGTVITLQHQGGRNIVFHLQNKRYEFDPNRIFTDKGIKKTLSQYSHYSTKAHLEVNKLATAIKKILPQGRVIAVHNNRNYSLKNYLPGHELNSDAKAVNYPDKTHYRNFYLVTKEKDFQHIKKRGFNGVLQMKNASDDGSLSIYLANSDYINVESAYDAIEAQIAMLESA